MTDLVTRYLQLGLRLGRVEEGLVDVYFGPPELAEAVAAEPAPTAGRLADEAAELLADLPDGWLRDQVSGVRAYAGVLAGERLTFAEEVAACYGVRTEFTDESVFAAAHEQLSELLPGSGPLGDRFRAWRTSQVLEPDRVEALARAAIELGRAWTERLVELPPGEGVELALVRDEAWSGFNEYQGDLRGLTSINLDHPRTALDTLHLVLHETYPGHQAERVLKDHRLVRGQGDLAETLVLVPTPQSLISEGLAELALDLVVDGPGGAEFTAALGVDVRHALAVERAIQPLRWADVNAAIMRSDEGRSDDEIRAYVRRWGLLDEEQAEHVLRFMSAPGNRTYLAVYPAGRELCRSYVDGDLARFRRLLADQVRVSDLDDPR
ncbi:hypothetical protein AB0M47_15800 [Hamadaea sp. NPDC051192]|uniref:hypothetical protein n=1 Tax=Hamadaea sp. NPDC051192 TaxID=3154940 RepID=UPI00343773B7